MTRPENPETVPCYGCGTELPAAFEMVTRRGAVYRLARNGAVVSRSNGPDGWRYSGAWRILGFRRRWNSGAYVPLEAAADGADWGHGYPVDLDHGTRRGWSERIASVSRVSESTL